MIFYSRWKEKEKGKEGKKKREGKNFNPHFSPLYLWIVGFPVGDRDGRNEKEEVRELGGNFRHVFSAKGGGWFAGRRG